MTLDEFFEKLPKTGWHFMDSAEFGKLRIRLGAGCQCPLEAVAIVDAGSVSICRLVEGIGLSFEDGKRIVYAADNWIGHDPALRARLLAHCGLEEPK